MRKLVVFSAIWCSPCRRVAKILQGLSIQVQCVDVDLCQQQAKAMGVSAIPSFMLYEDDKLVDTQVGLKTLDQLNQFVSQ